MQQDDELLEVVFSMQFIPWLYNKAQWDKVVAVMN
jgi:hypothetical protein